MGPTRKPMGPKRARPPKTERRIKREWILTPRPMSLGPKKLSIRLTAARAQIKSPREAAPWPVKYR